MGQTDAQTHSMVLVKTIPTRQ